MHQVKKATEEVISQIKHSMEQDVEFVTYVALPKERLMRCIFHMKNSFMIEGDAIMLAGGNKTIAQDVARRTALKKLILIQQYLLCDNMYFESMCGRVIVNKP